MRRLNRVPLFIAMAILAIIAATIAYTYWLRLQTARQAEAPAPNARSVPILIDAPDGFIKPKAPESIPVLAPPPPALAPSAPPAEPEDPNNPGVAAI